MFGSGVWVARPRPRRGVAWASLLFFACASALGAQSLAAPGSAGQGEPLLVWLESPAPAEQASLKLIDQGGKTLSRAEAFFYPSGEEGCLYGFLLAVPVRAKPGQARLLADLVLGESEGAVRHLEVDRPLTLESRSFAHEDIPLDKANSELRAAPDPARDAESLSFAKLFETRDDTCLFASGTMEKPLAAPWRQTASFADERRYLYYDGTKDSSLHGGLDLGAKEGSPVYACAAGRVAFAAKRILTGNTIVLEHLPGLFSLYMHLSAMDVVEGEIVDAGQLIGLVGSTGLSTGPHLHWELRVGLVSVDPRYWLTHPLLDKDVVSGRIKLPTEGR